MFYFNCILSFTCVSFQGLFLCSDQKKKRQGVRGGGADNVLVINVFYRGPYGLPPVGPFGPIAS